MKKLCAFALSIIILFSFAACENKPVYEDFNLTTASIREFEFKDNYFESQKEPYNELSSTFGGFILLAVDIINDIENDNTPCDYFYNMKDGILEGGKKYNDYFLENIDNTILSDEEKEIINSMTNSINLIEQYLSIDSTSNDRKEICKKLKENVIVIILAGK